MISKRGLIYAEMGVYNGVNIMMFPQLKIFFENKFGVLDSVDSWAKTHKKLNNLSDSLKKICRCKNRRKINGVSIRDDSPT